MNGFQITLPPFLLFLPQLHRACLCLSTLLQCTRFARAWRTVSLHSPFQFLFTLSAPADQSNPPSIRIQSPSCSWNEGEGKEKIEGKVIFQKLESENEFMCWTRRWFLCVCFSCMRWLPGSSKRRFWCEIMTWLGNNVSFLDFSSPD